MQRVASGNRIAEIIERRAAMLSDKQELCLAEVQSLYAVEGRNVDRYTVRAWDAECDAGRAGRENFTPGYLADIGICDHRKFTVETWWIDEDDKVATLVPNLCVKCGWKYRSTQCEHRHECNECRTNSVV